MPRAFLRSATHELTHTLNQIHQEQETAADNSIMTTTPSVADVLGGAATGEPGVFPDQIKLAQNTNVRHHLNHMPDPVIRPGGWPFASWFPTGAPQAADRHDFASSELTLTVTAGTKRVALGQPLDLSWTMTNTSGGSLRAPNDVSIEALFASITVTDGEGRERPVRPFAIVCEHAKMSELEAGQERLGLHESVLEHGGASPSSDRADTASTSRSRGRRRACWSACRVASMCSSTIRRAMPTTTRPISCCTPRLASGWHSVATPITLVKPVAGCRNSVRPRRQQAREL